MHSDTNRSVPDDITIDAEIRCRYSHADCWKLAKACHDLTGWPIVAVGYRPQDSTAGAIGWAHVAVRMPDGRCLDINGLHEEDDLLDMFEPFMRDDFHFPEDGIEEMVEVDVAEFDDTLSVDSDEISDQDVAVARTVIARYVPDEPHAVALTHLQP